MAILDEFVNVNIAIGFAFLLFAVWIGVFLVDYFYSIRHPYIQFFNAIHPRRLLRIRPGTPNKCSFLPFGQKDRRNEPSNLLIF